MSGSLIKSKLAAGEPFYGTFMFEFATPGIMRIIDQAGVDFAILDMEHSGWSIETIKMLIATSRTTKVAPIVRIPATDYQFIARVLDMGAAGIMAPMVESVEQAKRLVEYAKYPPVGRRGSAFSIAHDDYAPGTMADKIKAANEKVVVVGQIETAKGLEHVEEITKVEGIDVIFLGQADLTASLGIPGQFDHPTFLAAVDRILAACAANGKAFGYLALKLEDGPKMLARGAKMLAYNGDIWIYQHALKSAIQTLKNA